MINKLLINRINTKTTHPNFMAREKSLNHTSSLGCDKFVACNKKKVDSYSEIQFSPAASIDEAVKYGKNQLGIIRYIDFDNLDVINWANQALTEVKNSTKGRAKLPNFIFYNDGLPDDVYGNMSVGKVIRILSLNKMTFNNIDDTLSKVLMDSFLLSKESLSNGESLFPYCAEYFNNDELDQLMRGVEQFYNGNSLSFNEKMKLLNSFVLLDNMYYYHSECANPSEESYPIDLNIPPKIQYSQIFHEIGHSNDPLVKKRYLNCNNVEKKGRKMPKELKMWLDNSEKQKLASSVSLYAISGPGEFIAETFTAIMEGRKISDDVRKLYTEMQGPIF